MAILRGQVYFVELGPTRGKEQNSKRRPAAVVSINDLNRKPLVVVAVPGTTYRPGKPVHRNQVKVESVPHNGLRDATLFDCIQIKALDHSRFDQGPAGYLSPVDMARIEEAMKLCLGLVF